MANLQIVPAVKNVEPQYVEMRVPLYSYGCQRKVKNTLSHLKGIYSVSVDYEQQKVTVWGICNKHDVLATVRSKRREASFWNPQDNPNDVVHQDNIIIKEGTDFQEPPMRMAKPHTKARAASPLALTLFRARSLSLSVKLSLKKVLDRSFSF